MNGYPAGVDVEMYTFFRLIRRNLLTAVVIGFTLAAATFFGSSYLPAHFEARATLSIAPPQALGGVAEFAFTAPRTDSSAYVIVAESSTAISNMLTRLGVAPIGAETIRDAARRIQVSVAKGDDVDLINVSAMSDDSRLAADMANAMADILIEWDRARAESVLESSISALEAALVEVPASGEDQLADVVRAQQNSRYMTLIAMRGSATSSVDYVTRAAPPLEPSYPRPVLYAVIAFVTALVFVLAGAVIRPVISDRFNSSLEAASELRAQVIGDYQRRRTAGVDSRALRDAAAYSAANLIGTDPTDTAGNVVMVMSPTRSDQGPSFALGLAIAFADLGKRTIFIDGDLRNPVSFMNLTNRSGGSLGEALRRGVGSFRPTILRKGETKLDVIPASIESDDATVLLARGMPGLIASIAARYEFIVINTTPLLVAADALSFIVNADDIILLLDAEAVSRKDSILAAQLIRNKTDEEFSIVYTSRSRRSWPTPRSRNAKPARASLSEWDVDVGRGSSLTDSMAMEPANQGVQT